MRRVYARGVGTARRPNFKDPVTVISEGHYLPDMTSGERAPVWESDRNWATIRPFVYYQRENFVPEGLVEGKDVVDFSAGLGDLSDYVNSRGPASLTATAPEPHAPRPEALPASAQWVTDAGAERISSVLPHASADVILARMVIQFPTVEAHDVDVDDILDQMHGVLRPGGSVVVSTHSFFALPRFVGDHSNAADHLAAVEADLEPLLESGDVFARGVAFETHGLIQLIRYLDLPPREGPFGRTGFGLKIPMLVNSFIRQGYRVDNVEEIEPFTYPVDLDRTLEGTEMSVEALGQQIMAIKHRYLTSAEAKDAYLRPPVLAAMLDEIRAILPVTAVPIVRVCATRL